MTKRYANLASLSQHDKKIERKSSAGDTFRLACGRRKQIARL